MATQHILALYYSLTGQTELVMKTATQALEAQGHRVELVRLEPEAEWQLPWQKHLFFEHLMKMLLLRRQVIRPNRRLRLARPRYDLVLLGFQPWFLQPSIPVNSFLEDGDAEVLRNSPVALLLTARDRYIESLGMARHKVERHGGRVVDTLVVLQQGSEPSNIATTVYRLLENREPPRGHPIDLLTPFGIGSSVLPAVSAYAQSLGSRLQEQRLEPQSGWSTLCPARLAAYARP